MVNITLSTILQTKRSIEHYLTWKKLKVTYFLIQTSKNDSTKFELHSSIFHTCLLMLMILKTFSIATMTSIISKYTSNF